MRKFMMIISVIVLSIFLLSCGDGRLTDFEKVVKSIYDSELEIAGYNEVDIIKDGNLEVYKKEMNFLIQRGKTVRTEVDIVENKLSTSGNSLYDETKISYFTVDNAKYVELNGSTYENEYTMPTYYLTFVLSEDFLEKGYNLDDRLILNYNENVIMDGTTTGLDIFKIELDQDNVTNIEKI